MPSTRSGDGMANKVLFPLRGIRMSLARCASGRLMLACEAAPALWLVVMPGCTLAGGWRARIWEWLMQFKLGFLCIARGR